MHLGLEVRGLIAILLHTFHYFDTIMYKSIPCIESDTSDLSGNYCSWLQYGQ